MRESRGEERERKGEWERTKKKRERATERGGEGGKESQAIIKTD